MALLGFPDLDDHAMFVTPHKPHGPVQADHLVLMHTGASFRLKQTPELASGLAMNV